MLRTILILFLAARFCCIFADDTLKDDFSDRIVGGTNASIDEFPHQLALLENGYQVCGASLAVVNDLQIIVTAAHCVVGGYPESYSAVAGEYDLAEESDTEQRRRISKVITHPGYNGWSYENDIAILIPTEPFLLNQHVATILLPESPEPPTGEAVVSGWGSRDPKGSETILQKVTVDIVAQEICNASYHNNGYKIFDSMLCAGEEGRDSCSGDSGGPLEGTREEIRGFQDPGVSPQNERYLYGIVSFGIGCGRKDFPGVYTRTFSFLQWINEVVGNTKNQRTAAVWERYKPGRKLLRGCTINSSGKTYYK